MSQDIHGDMEHDCEHDHVHEIDEIELIDEEGNVLVFQLEEWFEYNDKIYAVLIDEDGEGLLFESVEEEDGYSFITPTDEEFEEVRAYYEELE
ncbi:MAG: DUF1292 domain-containing protein [Tissierellia bacterium]|nr:DUF1292 domain-containing protein [Tissierellia bacterium]